MFRKIGEFEKSGVKLQCSTEEGKQLLVRVIGKFEKMRPGSRNRDSTVTSDCILIMSPNYTDCIFRSEKVNSGPAMAKFENRKSEKRPMKGNKKYQPKRNALSSQFKAKGISA